MGRDFSTLGLDDDFGGMAPKGQTTEAKINEGLYQAINKELLHGKISDQQNEKAVYEMGENICKLYISYRVHIQKKKKCIQLKRKKIERNLILKWSKDQNTCILLSCFAVLCFTNIAFYFSD